VGEVFHDHTISDLILVDGGGPDFTPVGYAQHVGPVSGCVPAVTRGI
jgi:hypothetical protein